MGWGRMMLFGNIGQQLDIHDLGSAINQMQMALDQNQSLDRQQGKGIEALQRENRELKLYVATLIHLLVAKGVIKQEEVDIAVRSVEKT